MRLFTGFRLLVYLKRIAIAQERTAAVAEARLAHDRESWPKSKPPRPTEFGSFDVTEANARWQKEQEAAAVGLAPEEIT